MTASGIPPRFISGKLEDTLAQALSSTNWPNLHLRGRKPQRASKTVDAIARNEALLLICLVVYHLMHIARRALPRAIETGWSPRECGRQPVPDSSSMATTRRLHAPAALGPFGPSSNLKPLTARGPSLGSARVQRLPDRKSPPPDHPAQPRMRVDSPSYLRFLPP